MMNRAMRLKAMAILRNTLKILALLFLAACEVPCGELSGVNDLGGIPEETLDYLPYDDGDEVNYSYPGGLVYDCRVVRETIKQNEYHEDGCTRFSIIYELDATRITNPDSSLSILAWVNNLSEIHWYDAKVGQSRFRIPFSEEYRELADIKDSMLVNGKFYYEVFRLPRISIDPQGNDPMLADTLFFNVAQGILEVKMADGSAYQLLD